MSASIMRHAIACPHWCVTLHLLMSSFATGLCPSGCNCREDTLVVQCLNVNLEVFPITLNPMTQRLDLRGNRISEFKDAVSLYMDLKVLDLSSNKLTLIEEGSFRYSKHLVELRLARNRLERLNASNFLHLDHIVLLDLSHNRILHVEEFAFQSLKSLRVLYLDGNGMHTMSGDSLAGLVSLETLGLSDNAFLHPPAAALDSVSSTLHFLDLRSNRLATLQFCAFRNMTSLSFLDVSDQSLRSFQPSRCQLNKLKMLKARNTLLKTVPGRMWDSVPSLSELYLGRNLFKVVRSEFFENLGRLRVLELGKSPQLELIASNAFQFCHQLETLILDSNRKLSWIDAEAFRGLNTLRFVSFQNCNLKTLTAVLPSCVQIDLSGNPLDCNCSLSWLRNSSSNYSLVNDPRCENPDLLRNRSLTSLNAREVQCPNSITLWIVLLISGAVLFFILLLTVYRSLKRQHFLKCAQAKTATKFCSEKSRCLCTLNDEGYLFQTNGLRSHISITEL